MFNTFDTIGQVNPGVGRVAILFGTQGSGNLPPANVTITGNTCHDCYAFSWLQTSGNTQVRNNTIVVDHYSSGDLMVLSFPMTNIVIANNSGYLTPVAAAKGLIVNDVYVLDWGSSTLPWTNVLIHDNNWSFPGSYNYLFITSGAGWSAVNTQNIVWQNETCSGCKYDFNHGLDVASDSPTIPPFGPEVGLVEYSPGPFNVTVDASKERDGAELTILNYGNQTVIFNPDSNMGIGSPLTLLVGASVLFRYSGPTGKFVIAQHPATITANANTTPQSALINQALKTALAVTVHDSSNNPVEGIGVEFDAPAAGASGFFANGSNTAVVMTDATGVATSAFSANDAGGSFTVTATASGVSTPVTFALTNLTVLGTSPKITSSANTTFTEGTMGSFTVKATGSPAPAVVEMGPLPAALTFNATTHVLSGAPAADTGGIYNILLTASNGAGPDAVQAFALTVHQLPAITSANHATFTTGTPGSFTVTTTGWPAATVNKTGDLPNGVIFNAAAGVLSGTPGPNSGRTYELQFKTSNGVGPTAVQVFTLTVNQGPSITSANAATFTALTAGSFTVKATGFPTPALSESGTLPTGMTFNATSQVLSGTPAAGTGGTYTIQFTASNGLSPDAGQSFTLMVREAPVINSANQVTFVAGTATSFTLTATGFPAATLSKTGNLPNGLTFNASTGMLSGTPAPNATGIYHVQFKANNGVSPTAVQAFTLTVSR